MGQYGNDVKLIGRPTRKLKEAKAFQQDAFRRPGKDHQERLGKIWRPEPSLGRILDFDQLEFDRNVGVLDVESTPKEWFEFFHRDGQDMLVHLLFVPLTVRRTANLTS